MKRLRVGVDLSIPLGRSFILEANLYAERVTTADLVEGAVRRNAGVLAAVRYSPLF